MASSTALVPQRSRARSSGLVLAAAGERARAFRRAKLHSILVRVLRLALPGAALLLVAYYGISLRLAAGIAGFSMPTPPVITAEDLVMNTPRYEGFGKNGERYVVTARTAQQDLRDRSAPIRLTGIDGTLTQPDQTVTDLKATRGTFDNKQNELELYDGVDVVSQNGLRARLSRATVLTKEQKILSKEPVKVEMPTGTIRSKQLAIDQKARQVAFTHGVVAHLKPERKPGSEPAPAAARSFGAGDQPLDIAAERLDVDDAAKTAVFQGNVRAVQGEAVLESQRLDVEYEGQAAAGATQAPAAEAGGASRVKRILVPGHVVMTQGTDKVTSDRAEFDGGGEMARLIGSVVMTAGADRQARADRADLDQRSDSVLLTGNVIVVQGKNELKGRRLAVDRKSGRAQLTSPAASGLAAGRIFTRLYQGDGKDGAPAAGKKAAAASAKAQPAQPSVGLGMSGIKSDPSQPIDVEAVSLDVNDIARTAVYRGDVRVAQGEFRMATPEMTALYTGQMGLNVAPGQPRDAPKGQPTQMTRIEARKGVTVTTPDGRMVSGDWADFDVKANTVTIGGNVKLAQGAIGSQSFGHGGKLVIDLNTGENRLLMDGPTAALVEQAKRAVAPAGQPGATGAQPQQPLAAPAERPRMIIHPDHMKGIGPLKDKPAPKPSAQAPEAATIPTAPATGEPARKRPAVRPQAPAEPTSIFGPPGSN